MHHPESLDPALGSPALGSGLRTKATSDDDLWKSSTGDESSPEVFPGSTGPRDERAVHPRFTLHAAALELVTDDSAPPRDLRIVDVPTFFFYPFDHVAHQCAGEIHANGSMRRIAIHGDAEPETVRALLLGATGHADEGIVDERETRFTDLEALIVAIDAAIEWIGLDVRPPLDLTLDIDFERDGVVDPNDVTLAVRTTRDVYGRIEAHVVLFHDITNEALLLRAPLEVEKDLPVYPAPKKYPPPSEPSLAGPADPAPAA